MTTELVQANTDAMAQAFRDHTGAPPGQPMWNINMEKTWDVVAPAATAAVLRTAADAWLARDIHDDLCDYGPPGTCPCSLGEVYRWLRAAADRAEETP